MMMAATATITQIVNCPTLVIATDCSEEMVAHACGRKCSVVAGFC